MLSRARIEEDLRDWRFVAMIYDLYVDSTRKTLARGTSILSVDDCQVESLTTMKAL